MQDLFAVPDPEAEFDKLKESTNENEQNDDSEEKKKKENSAPKESKPKKVKVAKVNFTICVKKESDAFVLNVTEKKKVLVLHFF